MLTTGRNTIAHIGQRRQYSEVIGAAVRQGPPNTLVEHDPLQQPAQRLQHNVSSRAKKGGNNTVGKEGGGGGRKVGRDFAIAPRVSHHI